ncbi:GNAT family N-acetyltransferase [Vogesella sp. XCS3]|uniref:GNAT family N-acetyltransferase n=1 Tax=Vogesella sp. XCS3 TaxID=2877939 RepID=UPI001D0ABE74|nr:GNAT family N-acetyltransferase [Vogesella sp. XCS3]UDM16872.1 GNAT family N-acetyltransferase [Vogesella sp. XCS3]
MTTPALLDDLLALDVLTLRQHTEAAGDSFDPAAHRQQLAASLADSQLLLVRGSDGSLHGYALLRRQSATHWFVGMLNVHPAHRHRRVLHALFQQLAALPGWAADSVLQSHVYRTNQASLQFHKKLGFIPEQQNDKAVALSIRYDTLNARLQRLLTKEHA